MNTHILFFTQPGCLSCELMRVYLQAREIVFEEVDISNDVEARRTMSEKYRSNETPTIVIDAEVITGFDPARLDELLDPAPSSDSVTER
ncbi:MAG TPA: glutaredoxin domain-containing protein [Terriglobales bacterium]|nr:glutaredoxin domain-containing protein [Terriglobales bacterium]